MGRWAESMPKPVALLCLLAAGDGLSLSGEAQAKVCYVLHGVSA